MQQPMSPVFDSCCCLLLMLGLFIHIWFGHPIIHLSSNLWPKFHHHSLHLKIFRSLQFSLFFSSSSFLFMSLGFTHSKNSFQSPPFWLSLSYFVAFLFLPNSSVSRLILFRLPCMMREHLWLCDLVENQKLRILALKTSTVENHSHSFTSSLCVLCSFLTRFFYFLFRLFLFISLFM